VVMVVVVIITGQPMGCEAQLAAQLYKHVLWWPINPVN